MGDRLIGFSSSRLYLAPILCWPVVAYLWFDGDRFDLAPAWLDGYGVAGSYAAFMAWLIYGAVRVRVPWGEAFVLGLWMPFVELWVLCVLALMVEMAVHG